MSQVCTLDANGNYTCGTGGWTGPKPGDPNTANLLITAKPAFGGIDVEWTYPDTFPEAVAYTTLYRGTSSSFLNAVVHRAAVNGNFFYDPIENRDPTQYYYWIIITSVYGTKSEPIGPAWATAKPRIAQMIEDLTGQIDEGVLSQNLRSEIARIELNSLKITQEMLDRDAADDALGVRLNQITAELGDASAILQEEVLARTTADEAFVGVVNTMYADFNGNIAAFQEQITVLASDVSSLAQQLTTVESQLGDDIAQVQQTMQTQIDTTNGKVTEIGALWTVRMNVNGLVSGFGIYNNGQTAEAGFDVDRFWIGRTNANKRKPFIIDNNVVYIDEAAINYLTFSKLRDESGSFIVEGGRVKAQYLLVNEASIENASISSAKIKDAAITTAKIGDAQVDTLRIKGNAVTIPSSVTNGNTFEGAGVDQWMLVVAQAVNMDFPGYLQAMFGCTQSFGSGIRKYMFRLKIDGEVVGMGGGDWADGFPSLQGSKYLGAGNHNVQVEWWGENSGVGVTRMNLFTQGVMR
jgi:hypothetical protein